MLEINSTKEELENILDSFIWDFKIGDNIRYNLKVIYNLIKDYNKNKTDYRKPISILCVSVIEAIFVDFLYRLDMGTNHFPKKLEDLKFDIKNRLNEEKKETEGTFLEEVYKYKKLRNFGYKDVVNFLEEFSILGSSSQKYSTLQKIGHFRNRVHINNYFDNFERDESKTFSEKRTQVTINYMRKIFLYFKDNYSRP